MERPASFRLRDYIVDFQRSVEALSVDHSSSDQQDDFPPGERQNSSCTGSPVEAALQFRSHLVSPDELSAPQQTDLRSSLNHEHRASSKGGEGETAAEESGGRAVRDGGLDGNGPAFCPTGGVAGAVEGERDEEEEEEEKPRPPPTESEERTIPVAARPLSGNASISSEREKYTEKGGPVQYARGHSPALHPPNPKEGENSISTCRKVLSTTPHLSGGQHPNLRHVKEEIGARPVPVSLSGAKTRGGTRPQSAPSVLPSAQPPYLMARRGPPQFGRGEREAPMSHAPPPVPQHQVPSLTPQRPFPLSSSSAKRPPDSVRASRRASGASSGSVGHPSLGAEKAKEKEPHLPVKMKETSLLPSFGKAEVCGEEVGEEGGGEAVRLQLSVSRGTGAERGEEMLEKPASTLARVEPDSGVRNDRPRRIGGEPVPPSRSLQRRGAGGGRRSAERLGMWLAEKKRENERLLDSVGLSRELKKGEREGTGLLPRSPHTSLRNSRTFKKRGRSVPRRRGRGPVGRDRGGERVWIRDYGSVSVLGQEPEPWRSGFVPVSPFSWRCNLDDWETSENSFSSSLSAPSSLDELARITGKGKGGNGKEGLVQRVHGDRHSLRYAKLIRASEGQGCAPTFPFPGAGRGGTGTHQQGALAGRILSLRPVVGASTGAGSSALVPWFPPSSGAPGAVKAHAQAGKDGSPTSPLSAALRQRGDAYAVCSLSGSGTSSAAALSPLAAAYPTETSRPESELFDETFGGIFGVGGVGLADGLTGLRAAQGGASANPLLSGPSGDGLSGLLLPSPTSGSLQHFSDFERVVRSLSDTELLALFREQRGQHGDASEAARGVERKEQNADSPDEPPTASKHNSSVPLHASASREPPTLSSPLPPHSPPLSKPDATDASRIRTSHEVSRATQPLPKPSKREGCAPVVKSGGARRQLAPTPPIAPTQCRPSTSPRPPTLAASVSELLDRLEAGESLSGVIPPGESITGVIPPISSEDVMRMSRGEVGVDDDGNIPPLPLVNDSLLLSSSGGDLTMRGFQPLGEGATGEGVELSGLRLHSRSAVDAASLMQSGADLRDPTAAAFDLLASIAKALSVTPAGDPETVKSPQQILSEEEKNFVVSQDDRESPLSVRESREERGISPPVDSLGGGKTEEHRRGEPAGGEAELSSPGGKRRRVGSILRLPHPSLPPFGVPDPLHSKEKKPTSLKGLADSLQKLPLPTLPPHTRPSSAPPQSSKTVRPGALPTVGALCRMRRRTERSGGHMMRSVSADGRIGGQRGRVQRVPLHSPAVPPDSRSVSAHRPIAAALMNGEKISGKERQRQGRSPHRSHLLPSAKKETATAPLQESFPVGVSAPSPHTVTIREFLHSPSVQTQEVGLESSEEPPPYRPRDREFPFPATIASPPLVPGFAPHLPHLEGKQKERGTHPSTTLRPQHPNTTPSSPPLPDSHTVHLRGQVVGRQEGFSHFLQEIKYQQRTFPSASMGGSLEGLSSPGGLRFLPWGPLSSPGGLGRGALSLSRLGEDRERELEGGNGGFRVPRKTPLPDAQQPSLSVNLSPGGVGTAGVMGGPREGPISLPSPSSAFAPVCPPASLTARLQSEGQQEINGPNVTPSGRLWGILHRVMREAEEEEKNVGGKSARNPSGSFGDSSTISRFLSLGPHANTAPQTSSGPLQRRLDGAPPQPDPGFVIRLSSSLEREHVSAGLLARGTHGGVEEEGERTAREGAVENGREGVRSKCESEREQRGGDETVKRGGDETVKRGGDRTGSVCTPSFPVETSGNDTSVCELSRLPPAESAQRVQRTDRDREESPVTVFMKEGATSRSQMKGIPPEGERKKMPPASAAKPRCLEAADEDLGWRHTVSRLGFESNVLFPLHSPVVHRERAGRVAPVSSATAVLERPIDNQARESQGRRSIADRETNPRNGQVSDRSLLPSAGNESQNEKHVAVPDPRPSVGQHTRALAGSPAEIADEFRGGFRLSPLMPVDPTAFPSSQPSVLAAPLGASQSANEGSRENSHTRMPAERLSTAEDETTQWVDVIPLRVSAAPPFSLSR
uniref:Uncharacterized protein n=1 Tax=Chromera velia CCMP2878 TaxID=1169474 RepID=A0A0G4F059_9ALVE|eukprot:Cvel_14386.t1-p1 / transcript=Cvel_14386.t1 / gene=Cvel_14386 / organism=Chromera_velia_CCMP2878 / gene_product=hypothetical protein / transcript_product=hypothetical protein / location=Cvel_scaffold1021:15549-22583(-) / protein_length=2044 / sequence_SO=supercontig / SO=protein_coding / is_pseudo=false